MMKSLVCLAAVLALSGCADMSLGSPPPAVMATPFDPAAFDWALKPGGNTITGDAVLRTRGGDVKTCAGLNVELIPATSYTEEYISHRFGSPTGGISDSVSTMNGPILLNLGMEKYRVAKTCNAQGAFTFDHLADGAYYIIATVTWEAPSGYGQYTYMATQGGDIAKRVEVKGNQTVSVTLTA